MVSTTKNYGSYESISYWVNKINNVVESPHLLEAKLIVGMYIHK
jgi:hypothetical protein